MIYTIVTVSGFDANTTWKCPECKHDNNQKYGKVREAEDYVICAECGHFIKVSRVVDIPFNF